MCFHDFKFSIIKPAGLEQYEIGNADFPNIVKRTGKNDIVDKEWGYFFGRVVGLQQRFGKDF